MTKRWLSLVVVLTLLVSCFAGAAAEVTPKAANRQLTFTPNTSTAVEYKAGQAVAQLAIGTFAFEAGTTEDLINLRAVAANWFEATTGSYLQPTGVAVVSDTLYVTFSAPATPGNYKIAFISTFTGSYSVGNGTYDLTSLNGQTVLNIKVVEKDPAAVKIVDSSSSDVDKQEFAGITGEKKVTAKAYSDTKKAAEISGYDKFTWTSSNPSVATVAQEYSYDTTRAVIKPVSVGTATITATTANGKTAEVAVTVNPATYNETATTIKVDDTTTYNDLKVGNTYQLSVVIDAAGATTGTANGSTAVKLTKWSSANTAVATIDAATGVLTPVADGTTLITVTSEDGAFKKTQNITVSGIATDVQPVTFWVNGKKVSDGDVFDGPVQLEMRSATTGATIKYMTATATSTSPSYDNTYSQPITISNNGANWIYAQAEKGTNKSTGKHVGFRIYIKPTALTLDKTTVSVDKASGDQTFTVTATVAPADAYVDISVTSSDSEVIAKKDDAVGNTFTFEVKKAGKATLTFSTAVKTDASSYVTADDSGNGYKLKAACEVTVNDVKPTGITAPATIEVTKGQSVALPVTLTPDNASDKTVKYETSDKAKAIVVATPGSTTEQSGATADTVYVYGVAEGTAIITITANADATVRKTVSVTVKSDDGVNKVNAPVFTPGSGKVFTTAPSTGNEVQIASPMAGATVYFTLDGTQPNTTNATDYNSAQSTYQTGTLKFKSGESKVKILDNTTVTIRAIATKAGMTNSDESVGTFTSEIAVTGVTLAGTATINGKSSTTLTATVAPTQAKNQAITWTSDNESVAKVTVLNATQARIDGVAPGTANITVTTEDGAKTATCKVTVTEVKVTTIAASISTATVKAGETFDLTKQLTITPANATNAVLSWSSSDSSVATVDANGVVTGVATNSTNNATATITATCANASGTKTASFTVTVTKNDGAVATPTILANGAAVAASYDKPVTVTVTTATAGAQLYYTTDGTVPTANSTVVPAAGFEVSKTCTVRVAAIKEGLATAYATADIKISVEPTGVTVPSQTLAIGQTVKVTPVFTPANATYKSLTWDIPVNQRSIATVDAEGNVTALKAGTANLKLVVTKDDGSSTLEATGVIIVNNDPATSVTVLPSTATMKVGETLRLSAAVQPTTLQNATITWTSSDNSIAVVNASGVVTAKKAGSVTITASCGAVSDTCQITVEALSTDTEIPTKMITFTPTTKAFTAVENNSLSVELGRFTAGAGETWAQVTNYFNVIVTPECGTIASTAYVDANGVVYINIPNVGENDFTFEYKWKLEWKKEQGAAPDGNVLIGTVRTVTGNTVTITKKPTAINFTAATVADTSLEGGATATLDFGTISNYSAFTATGVAVTATANVSAEGITATAAIDGNGKVTAAVEGLVKGEYTVTVTLSASGCTSVTTGAAKVTVTSDKPVVPTEKAIVVAKGTAYKGIKGVTQLAKAEQYVTFDVTGLTEGQTVTWKSSKPAYVSIDEHGVATLKKAGKATITATISDGSKLTLSVNVNKGSFADPANITLQTKPDNKWVDVPAEGITVVPKKSGQKSVPSRLDSTDDGKIVIQKVEFSDGTIASRAGDNPSPIKVKKTSISDGKTTTLTITANGAQFSVVIKVDSGAKDVYLEDIIAEIEEIVEIEEVEEIEAE